ncbi:MAG: chalcone isomerase family protein [Burkholderiales bacterium]|nr:chalcone isomerase family protein [Burkholderiales bacterium]
MGSLNASANSLPEHLTRDVMGLAVRGNAVMRFFGLKVYDVRLWTPMKPFSYADPFVVELVYDMSLKGKDIADRSVKEMRAQGVNDEIKLKRWGDEMAKIFPDIKQGDALIGVSLPGKEARFYDREKLIATVPDPEFAKAFFDIWLSEKSSEPKLRLKLLGEQ